MDLRHSLGVAASLLASQLRGWRGMAAYRPASRQPEKLLELYEYEDCPYCRLVREALTELDFDALIYPCPKGGQRFRPSVREMGGKFLFPFLVDPNTGRQMYESADIVAYLLETYADAKPTPGFLDRRIKVATSTLASVVRARHGWRARPSKAPAQPLELFSFEASPYSRLVREALTELELPYVLRNTGKGHWKDLGPPVVRDRLHQAEKGTTRNRKVLAERTGSVQLPYLVDPNTGKEMYESAAILQYLEETYAA
ncbi:MAG: glutathione S-transferase N-terminal domain-containing protein [Nevskiaceae bacterium]